MNNKVMRKGKKDIIATNTIIITFLRASLYPMKL